MNALRARPANQGERAPQIGALGAHPTRRTDRLPLGSRGSPSDHPPIRNPPEIDTDSHTPLSNHQNCSLRPPGSAARSIDRGRRDARGYELGCDVSTGESDSPPGSCPTRDLSIGQARTPLEFPLAFHGGDQPPDSGCGHTPRSCGDVTANDFRDGSRGDVGSRTPATCIPSFVLDLTGTARHTLPQGKRDPACCPTDSARCAPALRSPARASPRRSRNGSSAGVPPGPARTATPSSPPSQSNPGGEPLRCVGSTGRGSLRRPAPWHVESASHRACLGAGHRGGETERDTGGPPPTLCASIIFEAGAAPDPLRAPRCPALPTSGRSRAQ